MKCLNCNHENNPNSLFCESCGTKLTTNQEPVNINNDETANENTTNEQIISNNMESNDNNHNNNYNNINNNDNNNTNNYNGYNNNINQNYIPNNQNQSQKKKNIWLIIGIVAAVIIGLIVIGSSSGGSSYIVNDKTKLQNYLTTIGFTEEDSTTYTYYKDGYTYTFDFYKSLFSQEKGDSMYNAYYYKKDIFGAAIATDSLKVVATYDLSTYDYACETEPTTYQTYTCNYMKSTITNLAETSKKTFYTIINGAEVSVNNL